MRKYKFLVALLASFSLLALTQSALAFADVIVKNESGMPVEVSIMSEKTEKKQGKKLTLANGETGSDRFSLLEGKGLRDYKPTGEVGIRFSKINGYDVTQDSLQFKAPLAGKHEIIFPINDIKIKDFEGTYFYVKASIKTTQFIPSGSQVFEQTITINSITAKGPKANEVMSKK